MGDGKPVFQVVATWEEKPQSFSKLALGIFAQSVVRFGHERRKPASLGS
jgi:hypothetical protein